MADLLEIASALAAHAPDALPKRFRIFEDRLCVFGPKFIEPTDLANVRQAWVVADDDLAAAILRDALTRAIVAKFCHLGIEAAYTEVYSRDVVPVDFRDGDDLSRLLSAFKHAFNIGSGNG